MRKMSDVVGAAADVLTGVVALLQSSKDATLENNPDPPYGPS